MDDLLQPRSLQDLCLNLLAEKPDILWSWKDKSQLSKPNGVEWKDTEIFLHNQFADKLLETLSQYKTLGDGILSTFTEEHVRLNNVKLGNTNSQYLTKDSLQVLSHHKLSSLEIRCPYDTNICTVLKCIGNKSYESLQHLVLQRRMPTELPLWIFEMGYWPCDDDLCGQSVIETLSRFNCLKRVDVASTDLTNTYLAILGTSLLHVENLDLSGNYQITDISPLKNCQKTLKSLSLGGLHVMTAESAMATFVTLTGLTYLDVNLEFGIFLRDSYNEYDRLSERFGMKVFTADMLLQMPGIFPNLVCLDLSGRIVRSELALSRFLEAHQSLQTLILWGSAACHFKSRQDYRPLLAVGGNATLEQYVAMLRHWSRFDKQEGYYTFHPRPVMMRLNIDLETKHFPPCGDDRLVQGRDRELAVEVMKALGQLQSPL